jgi:hypothetical protein
VAIFIFRDYPMNGNAHNMVNGLKGRARHTGDHRAYRCSSGRKPKLQLHAAPASIQTPRELGATMVPNAKILLLWIKMFFFAYLLSAFFANAQDSQSPSLTGGKIEQQDQQTESQASGCTDRISDCKSPVHDLGAKSNDPTCYCFACQYGKTKQTVICTREPSQVQDLMRRAEPAKETPRIGPLDDNTNKSEANPRKPAEATPTGTRMGTQTTDKQTADQTQASYMKANEKSTSGKRTKSAEAHHRNNGKTKEEIKRSGEPI